MRRSLKLRLTITLISFLLLGTLLLALLPSFQLNYAFMGVMRDQLLLQARQVAQIMTLPSPQQTEFLQELAAAGGQRITVFSAEGEVLQDYGAGAMPVEGGEAILYPELEAAKNEGSGWDIRYSQTSGENLLYVGVRAPNSRQEGLLVRLAIPFSQLQEGSIKNWMLVFAILFIFAAIAILMSLRMSHHITEPVQEVAQAAEKMAAGQLQHYVKYQREDELGALAKSFNRLVEFNQERYQEILSSKKQFETIIENTVSGILLFNSEGTVFLANPRSGQMLGFDHEADVPDNICRLVADRALCQELKKAAGINFQYNKTLELTYPQEQTLELHVIPLAVGGEHVAIFYDVSEASRLAKIRADLVTNVSHELKTPVTSIHGFAETLLADNLIENSTGRHFAEIIFQESQHLLDLVNNLLDLSYLELNPHALAREPLDLVQLLTEAVQGAHPFAADKQLEVELMIGVDSAKIQGDGKRLFQAVDNLIANAVRYSDVGGSIRVNLQYEQGGFEIAVRDSSQGIEPKHLSRVFERFYRVDKARSRHLGGTGLGLSLVKHIVELHGGQVRAESEAGQGTVFYICLPAGRDV